MRTFGKTYSIPLRSLVLLVLLATSQKACECDRWGAAILGVWFLSLTPGGTTSADYTFNFDETPEEATWELRPGDPNIIASASLSSLKATTTKLTVKAVGSPKEDVNPWFGLREANTSLGLNATSVNLHGNPAEKAKAEGTIHVSAVAPSLVMTNDGLEKFTQWQWVKEHSYSIWLIERIILKVKLQVVNDPRDTTWDFEINAMPWVTPNGEDCTRPPFKTVKRVDSKTVIAEFEQIYGQGEMACTYDAFKVGLKVNGNATHSGSGVTLQATDKFYGIQPALLSSGK